MILAMVEGRARETDYWYDFIYACSECGYHVSSWNPSLSKSKRFAKCPICGHEFDMKGKPHHYVIKIPNLEIRADPCKMPSCKSVAMKFSEEAKRTTRGDFNDREAGIFGWYEIYPLKFKNDGRYGRLVFQLNDEIRNRLGKEGYVLLTIKQWRLYWKEVAQIAVEQAKNMVV